MRCNLACDYCYIDKSDSVMSLSTAERIIQFIFDNARPSDTLDIGFFGGEPLLEFGLLKRIVELIMDHGSFNPEKARLSVTSNGTILNDEIVKYLSEKQISLCVSCDGPPAAQDRFRHFPNGEGTSTIVEKNLKRALEAMPFTSVNAVYSPETLRFLPETVSYFLSLGLRKIYLSPNISARWTQKEAALLSSVYSAVAEQYINANNSGRSAFISLIDSKISLLTQGGYKPAERCKMGKGEYAFGPSGNVYPCERLIGFDDGKTHCLGNIHSELSSNKMCQGVSSTSTNSECAECTLKDYCMNWCGCTNYYSTGRYSTVSAFTCSSEKAAIKTALDVIQKTQES
jgi:uncharacterized protein